MSGVSLNMEGRVRNRSRKRQSDVANVAHVLIADNDEGTSSDLTEAIRKIADCWPLSRVRQVRQEILDRSALHLCNERPGCVIDTGTTSLGAIEPHRKIQLNGGFDLTPLNQIVLGSPERLHFVRPAVAGEP